MAGGTLGDGLQIALCHLFFNIFGIMLWYPVPITRRLPIAAAKGLGMAIGRYKWFGIAYLIFVFGIVPGILLALSEAGLNVFLGIMIPFVVVFVILLIWHILRQKLPNRFLKGSFLWSNEFPQWLKTSDHAALTEEDEEVPKDEEDTTPHPDTDTLPPTNPLTGIATSSAASTSSPAGAAAPAPLPEPEGMSPTSVTSPTSL
eukprot:334506_1